VISEILFSPNGKQIFQQEEFDAKACMPQLKTIILSILDSQDSSNKKFRLLDSKEESVIYKCIMIFGMMCEGSTKLQFVVCDLDIINTILGEF
jgi:hypothetical protein